MAKGMYTETVLVTPEMAAKWLDESDGANPRPVLQRSVNYLVEEIKAKRWRLTPQGIAFNEQGLLIDGQHRLWAVVESKVAVPMRVTWNTPDAVKEVLDSGTLRGLHIRSGQTAPESSIYAFMVHALQTKTKTHPFQLYALERRFGSHIRALLAECPTAAAKFSSAPIRAAAVMAMERGERPSYVLRVYRDLVLKHTEALGPCAVQFWTQVLSSNGQMEERDRYARAYFTFCEENEMKRLKMHEAYRASAWNTLRDEVRNALNGCAKGA